VSVARKVKQRAVRRAMRVRTQVKKSDTPRVSIFRSLQQIYAQVIDDKTSTTLASCSTLEVAKTGKKTERAFNVGKELARKIIEQGLTRVTFDRGDKIFHGRVKAVAEGLREGGVQV